MVHYTKYTNSISFKGSSIIYNTRSSYVGYEGNRKNVS